MKQKKIQRKSNDDDVGGRSADNDEAMDTSREGADDSAGEEGQGSLGEARMTDSPGEGRMHEDSSDERCRSREAPTMISSSSQRHEDVRDLRHAHFLHGGLPPHLQMHHQLQQQQQPSIHHSHHPLYSHHRLPLPLGRRHSSPEEKEFAPNFLDRDRDHDYDLDRDRDCDRDLDIDTRSRLLSSREDSEDEDNEEINVVDTDQAEPTSPKPLVP